MQQGSINKITEKDCTHKLEIISNCIIKILYDKNYIDLYFENNILSYILSIKYINVIIRGYNYFKFMFNILSCLTKFKKFNIPEFSSSNY